MSVSHNDEHGALDLIFTQGLQKVSEASLKVSNYSIFVTEDAKGVTYIKSPQP